MRASSKACAWRDCGANQASPHYATSLRLTGLTDLPPAHCPPAPAPATTSAESPPADEYDDLRLEYQVGSSGCIAELTAEHTGQSVEQTIAVANARPTVTGVHVDHAVVNENGVVTLKDDTIPVPSDDTQMKRIAQLSGGQSYRATNIDELNKSYGAVLQQVGYQTVSAPATTGWLRLAVVVLTVAAFLALAVNRNLPA